MGAFANLSLMWSSRLSDNIEKEILSSDCYLCCIVWLLNMDPNLKLGKVIDVAYTRMLSVALNVTWRESFD